MCLFLCCWCVIYSFVGLYFASKFGRVFNSQLTVHRIILFACILLSRNVPYTLQNLFDGSRILLNSQISGYLIVFECKSTQKSKNCFLNPLSFEDVLGLQLRCHFSEWLVEFFFVMSISSINSEGDSYEHYWIIIIFQRFKALQELQWSQALIVKVTRAKKGFLYVVSASVYLALNFLTF